MKRMLGEAIGSSDGGGKWCEESQLTSAFLTRNSQGLRCWALDTIVLST